MSTADDWSRAYAKQAKADYETWDRLRRDGRSPECHQLYFLQMASEKLGKAHSLQKSRSNVGELLDKLTSSHLYIAKPLPIIAREQYSRHVGKTPMRHEYPMPHFRYLAREIERLAPSVDQQQRPDNCEYPWEIGPGSTRAPVEHQFSTLHLLTEPAGRILIKCLHAAILRFV
jgi:hypothetical protein